MPPWVPPLCENPACASGHLLLRECDEVFISAEGGVKFFVFHVELCQQKKLGREVSDCLAFVGQKHVFQRFRSPDNLKFRGFKVFRPLYCSFAL